MAQLYSWTTFPRSDVHPRDQIGVGDEVSRSDFEELNDDEFEELMRIGAIRNQPYPIPKDKAGNFVHEGSPREYALQQAAEMAEGVYSDVDNTWRVPQLQANAEAAMEATEDYDPGEVAGLGGDEEAAAEQSNVEKEQGTRKALEGRGLTPGSAAKRTGDKTAKE